MSTSISESLQFYGRETVLKMFESRNIEAWSLWQKKQFLTKGMGLEELDNFLTALESGNGNATYTIKVYEDINDVKKIKEKTEADGSFNFKLWEPEEREAHRMGYRNKLELEIEQLKLQIQQMQEEEEEDDEEEESMGFIGKVLNMFNEPEKVEKIINVVRTLLNPTPQHSQFIGNVHQLHMNENFEQQRPHMNTPQEQQQPGQQQPQQRQYNEQEYQRLSAAISTIVKSDNKALEHLEKLASIAEKTPGNFQTLLTILDAY